MGHEPVCRNGQRGLRQRPLRHQQHRCGFGPPAGHRQHGVAQGGQQVHRFLRARHVQLRRPLFSVGFAPSRRFLALRHRPQVGLVPRRVGRVASVERIVPARRRVARRAQNPRGLRRHGQPGLRQLPFAASHARQGLLLQQRQVAEHLFAQEQRQPRTGLGEKGRMERRHRLLVLQGASVGRRRLLFAPHDRPALRVRRARPALRLQRLLHQRRRGPEPGRRSHPVGHSRRHPQFPLDHHADPGPQHQQAGEVHQRGVQEPGVQNRLAQHPRRRLLPAAHRGAEPRRLLRSGVGGRRPRNGQRYSQEFHRRVGGRKQVGIPRFGLPRRHAGLEQQFHLPQLGAGLHPARFGRRQGLQQHAGRVREHQRHRSAQHHGFVARRPDFHRAGHLLVEIPRRRFLPQARQHFARLFHPVQAHE